MKSRFLIACAGLLLAGSAWAQPGPGMGGGMGPGMGPDNPPCMKTDTASRPADCHRRMNHHRHAGDALMTPEERTAHRNRVRSFKSREECLAYMTEHHAQMTERAKAKGWTLPTARNRACERLPAASK